MSDKTNEDIINVYFVLTQSPSTPRASATMPKNASISTLKEKASEATKIPLAKIKLIFRGRIITGDAESLISKFNIENETVVHCLGKPDAAAAASNQTNQSQTNQNQTEETTSAATASTVTAPSATANSITNNIESSPKTLEACLHKLKSQNSSEIYITALQTLSKMASNIIQKPHEEKYRKVKLSNAAFGRRIGNVPGGMDCIYAHGFSASTENGDQLVLNASPQAWTNLNEAKKKVDSELNKAKQETQGQPNQVPSSNTGSLFNNNSNPMSPFNMNNPSAPGAMGGMPNLDPDTMMNMFQNPMVQNMMRNDPTIANNPMLRQALDDPNMMNRMTQMMQDPMIRQMLSDPQYMQNMRNMISNPQMMQNMQQSMQNMFGGAGGAGAGGPNTNPNPFAQMMQNMQGAGAGAGAGSNPPTTGANTSSTTNNNTTNNSNSGNDGEMTEEEMIAEAIARSLRDENNDSSSSS